MNKHQNRVIFSAGMVKPAAITEELLNLLEISVSRKVITFSFAEYTGFATRNSTFM